MNEPMRNYDKAQRERDHELPPEDYELENRHSSVEWQEEKADLQEGNE